VVGECAVGGGHGQRGWGSTLTALTSPPKRLNCTVIAFFFEKQENKREGGRGKEGERERERGRGRGIEGDGEGERGRGGEG